LRRGCQRVLLPDEIEKNPGNEDGNPVNNKVDGGDRLLLKKEIGHVKGQKGYEYIVNQDVDV
jgi:hypothetical protein